MSVIVEGVDLPTSCEYCELRTGMYCTVLDINDYIFEFCEKNERPSFCPLTQLIFCKDCSYFYENNPKKHELHCEHSHTPYGFCFLGKRKD